MIRATRLQAISNYMQMVTLDYMREIRGFQLINNNAIGLFIIYTDYAIFV